MQENGPLFSAQQTTAITITERVASSVSVAASCLIIFTFVCFEGFRKPINRLVFYASFGNIMANVGTLISESGAQKGSGTALCQFQGFVIQWFMPADSLWTFSMACNVYLALFHHYNTDLLRPLEWKYFLFCYGVPFIPAFVFLFIETNSNGKVYGDAIQWCWVSQQWKWLQIALFYGPVWFIIALTFVIYVRVGIYMFLQQRQLGKYVHTDSAIESQLPSSQDTEDFVQQQRQQPQGEQEPQSEEVSDIPRLYRNRFTPGGDASLSSPAASRATTTPEARAAWAYSKYALLFFVAVLITWVPSSANRVYGLTSSSNYLFGLSYASGLVLPLQGFWNTVIYITVSWESMKTVPHEIAHFNPRSLPSVVAGKFHGAVTGNKPFRKIRSWIA